METSHSKALKRRLVDPSNISDKRDAVLRRVVKKEGLGKRTNEEFRQHIKPMYKSVERHAEHEIKKGGHKAVKNMKGKINYFAHLDARARNRGEER